MVTTSNNKGGTDQSTQAMQKAVSGSSGNPLEIFQNFRTNVPTLSLKDAVKKGVDATNFALAEMEFCTDTVSTGFMSRVKPLFNQVSYGIRKSIHYYEMRRYYGPQIIGGTMALSASLVGLRRGKVPKILSSSPPWLFILPASKDERPESF